MLPQPPRVIALSGATNFRDLGGYHGHGGRPLRWRRLFRSDHLGGLTPQDRRVLARLGLAAAFDFRGVDERAAAPYEVPGLTQHSLAIEPTVAQRMQGIARTGRPLTVSVVEGLMQDLYRGIVTHQAVRFAQFFRHLLAADAPLVFHCTAGKDRTGVAAALLLLALGVARDSVMADYLLTNQTLRAPRAARDDIAPQALQALLSVQRGYLEAALQVLDAEPGGVHDYLGRQVGLGASELQTLAERYLEPD